jgi:hypothetical protein
MEEVGGSWQRQSNALHAVKLTRIYQWLPEPARSFAAADKGPTLTRFALLE